MAACELVKFWVAAKLGKQCLRLVLEVAPGVSSCFSYIILYMLVACLPFFVCMQLHIICEPLRCD